jgi:preprotein translocase subunit SecE
VATQQETNAPNKPVHLIFLVGVVVAFYVLQWSIDWIWGYFGTPPSEFQISLFSAVVATAAGVIMYRSDKYYFLANEVATELKKVTWPTAKEVRTATMVVVVMAIISAVILGLFDFVWSNLTELVYG